MHRPIRLVALLIAIALGAVITPAGVDADTSASRPKPPSIAIDNDNFVHVAYDNADGLGIIYATNRSGRWVRKRITGGNDSIPHITVDTSDKIRIIFTRTFTDSPRRVYYTSNVTGEWVTKRLPWTAPGSTIRMAVSPTRKIHVVYATDSATYYVTNASGTWVRERLDVDFGTAPIIAVDVNDGVHIAFGQCLNDGSGTCEGEGIYYRSNASGSWQQSRITEFQGDRATSIVTDAAGAAHLMFERSYLVQGREELGTGMFYLTNKSGDWVRSKVSTAGRKAQIGIDPKGKIHIVYNLESETKHGIYYATNETGSWVRSTAVRERAIYQDMVVDRRGDIRMVFMRMEIDPGVYYTTNRSGVWSRIELMD